jgi:hypothetical protein
LSKVRCMRPSAQSDSRVRCGEVPKWLGAE